MDILIRDADGKWINSGVFREEALKFKKNKYYCPHPEGSVSYFEYWDEQLRRCIEGYEVGGHKITGHHYSYLNFCEIQLVPDTGTNTTTTAKKEIRPPDFWDGDYDYFWSLEIARNGLFGTSALATNKEQKIRYEQLTTDEERAHAKQMVLSRLGLRVKPHPDFLDGGNHMIVGKSRRKGYSYKNGQICANVYNTVRKSLTIIGAFDKKYLYPRGTMAMASEYLSYFNKNTAWGKGREAVDKQEHRKASFFKTLNGIKVEAGYQSEIMALTFQDNPDAAKGKDALYVLLEEAGVFPNLKAAYNATKPGLEAGSYVTGQIIIFGTGGDMESGTVDFAEMFYNPIQFGLMPFANTWDENAELTYCGFFHPVNMNMEGYYDEQGNSDFEGAKAHEMSIREFLTKNSTSSNVLSARVQEHPLCPSEAFLTVSTNDFPIVEIRARYNKVIREHLHTVLGQPCYLSRVEGKVTARPDLNGELEPLWSYKVKTKDLRGSVVIFEAPVIGAPRGLYKIGFDPYRQVDGTSLAAIYVYKCSHKFSYTREMIVAEYVGRPYSPDTVNRIAEMLAELYQTEIMHENEVTHVKGYFERIKKLHLLAAQPDLVIGRAVANSKVKRVYGIHMVEKLKDAGEKYIKEWLLTVRDFDEKGNPITNLDMVCDPAFLEELMYYNRKGNFDRVMAFMMVMFQVAEEDEEKEYGEDEVSSNGEDLLKLAKTQFAKQNSHNFGRR